MNLSTPTRELAGYLTGLTYDSLPLRVVESAKNCILDSLGCALGGSQAGGMVELARTMARYGGERGVSVWGLGVCAPAPLAAVLNGTSAHALEMDDVHREAKAHAGAVVVPAALTLGEDRNISGRELILAVVAGYETMLRIGAGIGAASHRLKGWHATGTCGTFGAAAAAGKILGLDNEGLTWALGLAGTQSFGLWAFTADGAGNKKFHAGRAAESGILAAILAEGGMSGPAHILDAKDGGLFAATSDEYSLEKVTAGLGERFLITEVSVKPYSCCRSMHPGIDAALMLRRNHDIDPARINRIAIGTYEVAVQQCGFTNRPRNTAEAQFSLPYGVAVALTDGSALLDQFSAQRIRDGRLLDLASRVELAVDPEFHRLYPARWGCRLQVELQDGQILTQEVLAAKGDPENPLTKEELRDKFLGLAQGAIGQHQANLVADMIGHLEEMDTVLPLTGLLGGKPH